MSYRGLMRFSSVSLLPPSIPAGGEGRGSAVKRAQFLFLVCLLIFSQYLLRNGSLSLFPFWWFLVSDDFVGKMLPDHVIFDCGHTYKRNAYIIDEICTCAHNFCQGRDLGCRYFLSLGFLADTVLNALLGRLTHPHHTP